MRRCSQRLGLNIEVILLKPMHEESFWVNMIGRGYPPPNRNKQRGVIMNTDLNELNRLREVEDKITAEKGVSADTLRRMVAKVEEYSESHRAMGLPDDLLNILKDDLERQAASRN